MASGRFMEEMMREHEQSLLEATCGSLFDHIDDLLDFPKEDCAADVLLLDAPAPGSPLAARVLHADGLPPVKAEQPEFLALPPPPPAAPAGEESAFMNALVVFAFKNPRSRIRGGRSPIVFALFHSRLSLLLLLCLIFPSARTTLHCSRSARPSSSSSQTASRAREPARERGRVEQPTAFTARVARRGRGDVRMARGSSVDQRPGRPHLPPPKLRAGHGSSRPGPGQDEALAVRGVAGLHAGADHGGCGGGGRRI